MNINKGDIVKTIQYDNKNYPYWLIVILDINKNYVLLRNTIIGNEIECTIDNLKSNYKKI